MNATTFRVSLCESCIWTDANGLPPWETDAEPMTKLRGYVIGTNDACGCSEYGGHFGGNCDGCETPFGGTRYCYVAVLR